PEEVVGAVDLFRWLPAVSEVVEVVVEPRGVVVGRAEDVVAAKATLQAAEEPGATLDHGRLPQQVPGGEHEVVGLVRQSREERREAGAGQAQVEIRDLEDAE